MSIKNLLITAATRCCLHKMTMWYMAKRNKGIVLMYHGICKNDDALADGDVLQVKVSDFEKQVQWLSENFQIVKLSQLSSLLYKNNTGKPYCCITFDDGYRSVHDLALPILIKYNAPATVFLVTNYLTESRFFWWDLIRIALKREEKSEEEITTEIEKIKYLYSAGFLQFYSENKALPLSTAEENTYAILTKEEVQSMLGHSLIDVGSHTANHEILTTITNNETAISLENSLKVIQNLYSNTSHPIFFCYPNGDYNHQHVLQVDYLSYKGAVITKGGWVSQQSHPFEIPRIGINQNTTLSIFKYLCSGLFMLYRRVKS